MIKAQAHGLTSALVRFVRVADSPGPALRRRIIRVLIFIISFISVRRTIKRLLFRRQYHAIDLVVSFLYPFPFSVGTFLAMYNGWYRVPDEIVDDAHPTAAAIASIGPRFGHAIEQMIIGAALVVIVPSTIIGLSGILPRSFAWFDARMGGPKQKRGRKVQRYLIFVATLPLFALPIGELISPRLLELIDALPCLLIVPLGIINQRRYVHLAAFIALEKALTRCSIFVGIGYTILAAAAYLVAILSADVIQTIHH